MSEFVMPSGAELRALNWLAENYAMGDENGPTLRLHVEKLEDGGSLLFLGGNDGSYHRFSRALADYAEYVQLMDTEST